MTHHVFFTVNGERIRVHSMFTTEQEAQASMNGDLNLKIIFAFHELFIVAFKDVEPPLEAIATMRVTADEVRAFNDTLTNEEVHEVLCGVENDMQPDITFWIDEVVKKRPNIETQRATVSNFVEREKAGEPLYPADYEEALLIYKKRMAVLGYVHLEYQTVEDIINKPYEALPEILSCFPPVSSSTQEQLISGALPDEVQP